MTKERSEVPKEVAAQVLFRSDRTCCVCRERGKSVQIHHIDGDPTNHDPANLSALCFDCHEETQIKGGFGRKLDTHQVVQYRDDWRDRVVKRRDLADELASARAVGVSVAFGTDAAKSVPPGAPRDTAAEQADLFTYIEALPAIRLEANARAHRLWDTGVTAEMMKGSYEVIDVLEQVLVRLTSWYPQNHFGEGSAQEYITRLTASRFEWHRAHLEPYGPGSRGTMVRLMAAGNVMADLERMVTEMVSSLTDERFDYRSWLERWNL